MSSIPNDLKYTKEHEWVRVDGDIATIGITDYAQESLGDITYVELPSVGDSLALGDTFGVVESVKAASDLYAPLTGEVIEVNDSLEDSPEQVNADAFGEGWMLKLKIEDAAQLGSLLSAEDYQQVID